MRMWIKSLTDAVTAYQQAIEITPMIEEGDQPLEFNEQQQKEDAQDEIVVDEDGDTNEDVTDEMVIDGKKPASNGSTKIFSDDSIVDSVKKTPVKNLSPYPSLKIQDAGDKSLDPTFKPEKATRQQREIRKKALNFLEHVSGLLNAAAEFDDRVTR